jgi:hypothetical protein
MKFILNITIKIIFNLLSNVMIFTSLLQSYYTKAMCQYGKHDLSHFQLTASVAQIFTEPLYLVDSSRNIHSSSRLYVTFYNTFIVYSDGVVIPHTQPQAGGPPLVACPRLLIQFIHRCCP